MSLTRFHYIAPGFSLEFFLCRTYGIYRLAFPGPFGCRVSRFQHLLNLSYVFSVYSICMQGLMSRVCVFVCIRARVLWTHMQSQPAHWTWHSPPTLRPGCLLAPLLRARRPSYGQRQRPARNPCPPPLAARAPSLAVRAWYSAASRQWPGALRTDLSLYSPAPIDAGTTCQMCLRYTHVAPVGATNNTWPDWQQSKAPENRL